MWWGVGGFGALKGWGCGYAVGVERLGFWEALLFVFAVMVWVLSGGVGVGGFGVLRGCGCGVGAERLGFWEALLFVFVAMVWVLSGVTGGGWFRGAEGLGLRGYGRGGRWPTACRACTWGCG